MTSTTQAYQAVYARLPKTLESLGKRSDVKRETDYFLSKIGTIKSAADLVADQRVYSYVLKAFGLSDMAFGKALMRKVLEEGPDASTSMANKLTDQRFKALAQAFNFARYGTGATALDAARQGTVSRYVRLTLEDEAGRDNEGVRLALNFERKAAQLTSAYGILADKALLQVAKTALQLPDSFSSLDIDKQASLLAQKINVKDFAQAEKRGKFLQRFTAMWDISNPSSQQTSASAVLGGPGDQTTISVGVLQSLQALRTSGR